jgi:transposase-like protein
MAATRLTDSQKIEIVARYCSGEGSAELADAYGCSTNTVSRVVKAGLQPAEYEQLKQQRNRPIKVVLEPEASELEAPEHEAPEPDQDDDVALLAIDDADDFGDVASEDADVDDDLDTEFDFADEDLADQFVAVPLLLVDHAGEPVQCQPLAEAPLPASVYMLVDKTVELQAKPLKEFPELGQLPDGEKERQALMVFANPRQAKRQCGRSQRVIKVPDTRVLERTAPYLIAQGISRVVMEGSLYSLPGS